MELHTIGIDLGKTVFHLVGLNLRGEVVVRKKFSRAQLLRFTANRQVDLIGMEACGGAHFLGRALREQGHEVRLMPAQYVKPFVKTNKSDYIDAEAIAEAVTRPTMRFVPIKSDDQLDLQSLHRVRERWVMRRTAVVNQIRRLLLERGLTLPKGRSHVDNALPGILEDAELNLSDSFRVLLAQLQLELEQLTERIEQMDGVIHKKRGNKYLRTLFIQGARSVVQQRHKQAPGLSSWLAQLLARAHQNEIIVALANKLVRMAWAVLCRNEHYRAPVLAVTT